MQIVIDIPEGLKLDFENERWTALSCMEMKDALMNGIQLPKGHGRLMDYGCVVDAIDDWINSGENEYSNATVYLRNRIRNAPTIVEADGGDAEC